MTLCRFCFEEVTDGIPVPGYQTASSAVHEACLASAAVRFAQDSQREGLLRYLIGYEEGHAPDEWASSVSGGSADVCWDWKKAGLPYSKLHPLLNGGLISIVFSTNSGTDYALVGRNAIKEALGKAEETPEASDAELEIPDDLFRCIIGYEDVKEEMRFTLENKRRTHYLLIGPPATAKSLFLLELGRLRGVYRATGSRVSGAGLTDALFSHEPRILLLDEIDKIPMDATAVLLSVMESGEVLETKHRRHRGLTLDLTVFAAGNSDKALPPELLSRFDTRLHFEAYSFEEFLSVCRGYLSSYESIPPDLAEYIGQKTWRELDRDVRTARGIARRLRENTANDVDRVVRFLKKYSKQPLSTVPV